MKPLKERLSEKAAINRVPLMSAFELLPVCNLNCKMCYVRKSMSEVKRTGGLKDAAWWLNLAAQARDEGMLFPLLTGGEPFLHPQFFEILEGLIGMGMQPSINSNGTLITREVAEKLSVHRPLRINLTLYGASEAAYKRLCGDGSAFHRVREAVALLKEYGIPVKFNASITPDNVDDLEAIIAYAKSQGSPVQVATYMFPPIRRDESMVGRNARLTPEEAALARVRADYLQNEPEWFCSVARSFSRFVPLDQLAQHRKPETELGMRCRAGVCSFWVDWQGNLMNCGMYPSVKLDLADSFHDKWKELTELTAAVRHKPGCAGCPNIGLCHSCIAMVSNECGDVNGTPEYLCRMNEAAARLYNEFARKYYPDIQPDVNVDPQSQDSCEL